MKLFFSHYFFYTPDEVGRLYNIVDAFNDLSKLFFSRKRFSSMINTVDINLICGDDEHKQIRPRYIEDKHPKVFPRKKDSPTFHIYHKLDIYVILSEAIIKCDDREAVAIIKDTIINYISETAMPVKIRKSFDKDRFIADLRQFFDTFIEQRGWEQEGKKEESHEWYRTVQEPDGTTKIERIKDGVATVVFTKNKDGGFEIL